MTATLVKSPLRMALSMTSEHDAPVEPMADAAGRPLGYLYSAWESDSMEQASAELGHYDHESQTWVDPDGVDPVNAGVRTTTRKRIIGWNGPIWITVTDDACF